MSEELTLYAGPFTCSLAVHLTLVEQQRSFRIVWVDRITHRMEDGADFEQVNPKGKVAALLLEDGRLLTENVAILAWLDGSADVRLLEWLTFVGTEVHKQLLFPWFHPTADDGVRAFVDRLREPVFAHLERTLSRQPTLLGGDEPSVADHYLLWTLLLAGEAWGRSLPDGVNAFRKRMLARPTVQRVVAVERAALGVG